MRLFAAALTAWMIFAGTSAFAQNTKLGTEIDLTKAQIRFQLGTQDGSRTYSCQHKMVNPSGYDWDVICGDGQNFRREFGVHMLINQYTLPYPPKMKYEILFWVTARNLPAGQGRFVGSTTWMHLNEASDLNLFEVGQDVEEVWSLRAAIKPSGAIRAMNPRARQRK